MVCIFKIFFSSSIVHFNEKYMEFLLSRLLKVREQRMTSD